MFLSFIGISLTSMTNRHMQKPVESKITIFAKSSIFDVRLCFPYASEHNSKIITKLHYRLLSLGKQRVKNLACTCFLENLFFAYWQLDQFLFLSYPGIPGKCHRQIWQTGTITEIPSFLEIFSLKKRVPLGETIKVERSYSKGLCVSFKLLDLFWCYLQFDYCISWI